MAWARALKLATTPPAIPAVVLCCVLACGTLAACEYTYGDGRTASSSPTSSRPTSAVITDPALTSDPALGQTVTGDALTSWAEDVLPDVNGLSFDSSFGVLSAGESRAEETTQLPGGTYAVTLACRGTRNAEFTIRNGNDILIEVMLQCGTTRVKVVQLATDAVLGITVTANAQANFAYRVSRI